MVQSHMVLETPFGTCKPTDLPPEMLARWTNARITKRGMPDRRKDKALWADLMAWAQARYLAA